LGRRTAAPRGPDRDSPESDRGDRFSTGKNRLPDLQVFRDTGVRGGAEQRTRFSFVRDGRMREVDGMSSGKWNAQYRDPSKIPDNIKRLMAPEEQARIGYKPPAPSTTPQDPEEQTEQDRKAEKKIQEQIRAYLWGQHGIELIIPPMHRASALPEGWPDITFSFYGRAVALEVKTQEGKCRKEQLARHEKMRAEPNCWHVEVVRSVEDARRILETLRNERKNGHGWTPGTKDETAGPSTRNHSSGLLGT
jgi:hypothetical protein